jgi:hypothetical protein
MKTTRRLLVVCFILVWLGMAAVADAAMIEMSLKDLTRQAPAVIQAKVGEAWTEWGKNRRFIYTHILLDVSETVKGDVPAQVEVLVLGGVKDGIGQAFSDMPRFTSGETVIVFLDPIEGKDSYTIVGHFQGKATVIDEYVVAKGMSVDQYKDKIRSFIE